MMKIILIGVITSIGLDVAAIERSDDHHDHLIGQYLLLYSTIHSTISIFFFWGHMEKRIYDSPIEYDDDRVARIAVAADIIE